MTTEELQDQAHELLFGVRRSVRYHGRRRAFFDRFNLLVNAVVLVMGSATVYGVLKAGHEHVALIAAGIVTALSAINLAGGSARQALLHRDLARNFIALERKIVAAPIPDQAMLAAWTTERLEIEEDEPPKLHVLDCICHNDLMRAMGYSPKEFARVGWLQRMLANVCDFREYTTR